MRIQSGRGDRNFEYSRDIFPGSPSGFFPLHFIPGAKYPDVPDRILDSLNRDDAAGNVELEEVERFFIF